MVFADVHITEEGVALELLAVMRSLVAITVIMRRRWSSLFQVTDSRKLPFLFALSYISQDLYADLRNHALEAEQCKCRSETES